MTRLNLKDKPYLGLLVLTFAALLVHGYHPAAEDAEIYIPGIKKLLNPALYPFGSEFFLNHARLTQFERLIAATIRISDLPFDLGGSAYNSPACRWLFAGQIGRFCCSAPLSCREKRGKRWRQGQQQSK